MAKEKNPAYGDKVVTGECFASFPHLAEIDTGREYSSKKFSINAIFIDEDSMKPLVDACKTLAMTNFKTLDKVIFPWKDGSEGSTSKYQGFAGRAYICPKTGPDKPPVVVGPNPKTNPADAIGVFDSAKIYSGAIIRVNVTPKAYLMDKEVTIVLPDGMEKKETRKQKGITLYLNAVQFVRDSERFGGYDAVSGGFDDNGGATAATEELF